MAELVIERRIAAPPSLVFEFLTDSTKLLAWLGVSGEVEPHPGGRFHVDITGGDVVDGRFLDIEPPHRVVFSWGWIDNSEVPPGSSTVTIELTGGPDHTDLTLTHAGLPLPVAAGHRAGWRYFLERLTVTVRGGAPGPIDVSQIDEEEP